MLVALYGARQEVAGISLAGAVTYTGLSQAVIGLLSMFSWYEVMNSVYTGDIASDLLKPLNYFTFWLARDLGRAGAALLMRGFTIMAAYAVVFGITTPESGVQCSVASILHSSGSRCDAAALTNCFSARSASPSRFWGPNC